MAKTKILSVEKNDKQNIEVVKFDIESESIYPEGFLKKKKHQPACKVLAVTVADKPKPNDVFAVTEQLYCVYGNTFSDTLKLFLISEDGSIVLFTTIAFLFISMISTWWHGQKIKNK